MGGKAGEEHTAQHKEGRQEPTWQCYFSTWFIFMFFALFCFVFPLAFQFPAVQHRECGPGIHLDGGRGG